MGPLCDRPCSDVFLTVAFYIYAKFASYNSVKACVKYFVMSFQEYSLRNAYTSHVHLILRLSQNILSTEFRDTKILCLFQSHWLKNITGGIRI